MSKFNITHALEEFNTLVFARVSRVQQPDKSNPYYYGFAVRVKRIDGDLKKNTIWFKKNQHLSERNGFFALGVSHVPENKMPERGDIIVGKVKTLEKGPTYIMWTNRARPWLEFTRMLIHGRRSMKNAEKAYSLLRLEHTRSKTTDDLYLVARLLILNDVGSLMAQYMSEEHRPKHPRKKIKENGYQRQKGFDIEFEPIELAYYVAEFARDERILLECINYVNKYAIILVDWTS